jgi:cytochrome P450
MMQPAFQPQRVAAFTELMTVAVAARLTDWRQFAEKGHPLDIASEMMRLTYTIVGRALFGADVTTDVAAVEEAATVVMAHAWHRLEKVFDWPAFVPTPRNRHFRTALNVIDRIVYRIIEERRRQPGERNDLLSLLLAERDEETGGRMSEEQLRNEAVTLLLAGHETTANALTWIWYLLSRYPEAGRRVRAEAAEVLSGRAPTFEDLARLKYTTLVIQEAMRLYPPIWIMERHVLADDEIGEYRIPGGSALVLCPYVTHRHPDFWDNPEGFDPERFLPERSGARPHHAYFPFGGGQRLCIGSTLAMTEAQVVTAMVAQQYRLDLVPGCRAEPQPGITLRCRGGLLMSLHAQK